jgi:hypothetical protein
MRSHLVHVLMIALSTTTAWGHDVSEGAVSGQGTVVIERMPDVLRVEVLLLARGKDYRDALTRLDARRAMAGKRLVELGASEDTIASSDPAIIPARQNPRPISVASTDGLAPADDSVSRAAPPPDSRARPVATAVSERLRADLPLRATGPDDLLLVSEDLQRRIKEADLAGIKELGEDATQLEIPGCGVCGGGTEPGTPTFQFVSRIGAKERSKALAIAFGRARSEASQLAQAAGCELGGLRSLSGPSSGALDLRGVVSSPFAGGGTPQIIGTALSTGTDGPSSEGHEEAIGIKPGKIQHRIGVTATFALKSLSEERTADHRPE